MKADRALAELLLQMGLVQPSELEHVPRGAAWAAYCARLGMSEAELLASIARELGLRMDPNPRIEIEHAVSAATMRRRGFLPLRREGGALHIAVCRPWDPGLTQALGAAFPGERIERCVTTEAVIAAALQPGIGRSSSGVTTSELGAPTEVLEGERGVATQVVRTRRDQAQTMVAPAVQGSEPPEPSLESQPTAPATPLVEVQRRLAALPQWAWIAAVVCVAFLGLLLALGGGAGAEPEASKRYVSQAGAPLRVFRREDSKVLATLPIGRELTLLQEGGAWALVLLSADGPAGFVSARALATEFPLEALAKSLEFTGCEGSGCADTLATQRRACAERCGSHARCPELCERAAERCAAACAE